MEKIDCFAYKPKSCNALTEKKCDGCGFYKTKEEFRLGHKKALERIKTLDKELQEHIEEKYFKRGVI